MCLYNRGFGHVKKPLHFYQLLSVPIQVHYESLVLGLNKEIVKIILRFIDFIR